MAVAVLERLSHLGGQDQKQPAEGHQADGRSRHSQPTQRSASQAAQGQHLKKVDRAQSGQGQESECEQPRVDRHQPLSLRCRKGHDRERPESKQGLAHRSRVTHVHVSLIPPLLSALHDLVLRRAHERAPTTSCTHERHQDRQGHTGAHQLA